MKKLRNLFKKSKPIKQENNVVSPSSESIDTKCSSITFAHEWTIENYSRLYDDDYPWKWEIGSQYFSPPNNEQFKFGLDLHPKGCSEVWKNYVSIGVNVRDIPQMYEGKIICQWNVAIENANGDRCPIGKMMRGGLFRNQGRIQTDFIEVFELLNSSSQYLAYDQLTLHFSIHLQADEPIFSIITNNETGQSRFDGAMKVNKLTHTWTIESVDDLFDSSQVIPNFILSDHFPAIEGQSERFCLRFYPNGWADEVDSDNVDIVFWNDTQMSVNVHIKMSILDVDGDECYSQDGTDKIDYKYGRIFEYKRTFLLDNSNGLVHDNKLRICCEMIYMMNSIESNQTVSKSRMWPNVFKSEGNFNVTQKAIHFVEHQWTIDKFSALCLDSPPNRHHISSQIFKPPTDTRFAFHLRLWPNGEDENSSQYVSLHLCNVSSKLENQVTVQYRASIRAATEDKVRKWENQSNIPKSYHAMKSDFLSLSKLQDPAFIDQHLLDDKLTIIFQLFVLEDKKVFKPRPTQEVLVNHNPSGSSSSAVLDLSNANLKGAIINVQSVLKLGDFNVKT